MTVSKKSKPSKIEIWVGRFLALAFFSIVAYVCFYFAQLYYYRSHYPIEFVDLRDIPATQPRNPEDRVWETLDQLSKQIEVPDKADVDDFQYTQTAMVEFVASHRQVLADFRQWRDGARPSYGLEAYEGMGLRRRVPGFQPDQPEESIPKLYYGTYHKLAELLMAKGILAFQDNRETEALTWVTDSFAIGHFLLQNPTYFGLHSATRIFKTNVDLLLQNLPKPAWQPHIARWLPTEGAWRSGLQQGMWFRKCYDFRCVERYLGLRAELKPSWATTLRFQYSRIDTLRHFSEHYQQIREAALFGPMVFPKHNPEADKLSRKINRMGAEMMAIIGYLELEHFYDVAMAIAASHAILAKANLSTAGTPITASSIQQYFREEGISDPFTNEAYRVTAQGALVIPMEPASLKHFGLRETPPNQSRYQIYFDHGLLVPAGELE